MHFVFPFPGLIQQCELEQSPDIGAVASERDEDGDVDGRILGVLAVGVKVNGPIVAGDAESIAGDILAGTHALGQGVTPDCETVGPIHRLVDRPGARFVVIRAHLIAGTPNRSVTRGIPVTEDE